jgi:hypothetical protein
LTANDPRALWHYPKPRKRPFSGLSHKSARIALPAYPWGWAENTASSD